MENFSAVTYQRLSKVFNRLVGLGKMINSSSYRSSVYLIGTVKYELLSVMILHEHVSQLIILLDMDSYKSQISSQQQDLESN